MAQQIRLTEQQLNEMVAECVNEILNEEVKEGFLGGMKSTGQRMWNKLTNREDYKKVDNSDLTQDNQGNFFNRVGSKIDKFGNSVENAKKTYQVGSANQDAQKAIKNAISSLKALMNASEKMKSVGGGGLQGKQLAAIKAAYDALTSGQGIASISGGFQGSANAVNQGGKLGGWKE